jgi:hypothetical protein
LIQSWTDRAVSEDLERLFQIVGWSSKEKVSSTVVRGSTANSHRNVTRAVSGPVYFGREGMVAEEAPEVEASGMIMDF